MVKPTKEVHATLSVFLIMSALKIVVLIFPDSRLWALHHINFLSDMIIYLILLISLAVIAFTFFSRGELLSNRLVSLFNGIFYHNDNKQYCRLIFTVVCTIFFILFLAPTHFLGDGYTWLNNLTGEQATVFKWSESGATTILSIIQCSLGAQNEQTSLLTFQIVSVISGAATILFYFGIAGVTSDDSTKRFLTFMSLLFSGTLLMFFGYVENYPILFPVISAFFFFALKYLKNGTGLISASIVLLLAIILHLQTAIFVPGLIYLYFCNPTGQKLFRKFKQYIYFLLISILGLGIFVFYSKYTTNLYFENMFLPLFEGKPIYPDYTLFSVKHLLDIANQLLLISPLLPFLIVLSVKNWRRSLTNRISVFLILISVSSLFFLFVIDPKLGMPRDWDLFALTGIGLTFFTIVNINRKTLSNIRPFLLSLLLIAIIAIIPFLMTSLNTARSLEQMNYIIQLDKEKSLSSTITLRNYHRNNGNRSAADSANMLYELYNQNESKINKAFRSLEEGNYKHAGDIFQTIKTDKFNSNYNNLVSIINMYSNRFEKALQFNNYAQQLRAYDPKIIASNYFPGHPKQSPPVCCYLRPEWYMAVQYPKQLCR